MVLITPKLLEELQRQKRANTGREATLQAAHKALSEMETALACMGVRMTAHADIVREALR